MSVRLTKPKSKIYQPAFELFGQPWICGEAAHEKYELLTINHERCSRIFKDGPSWWEAAV